MVSGYVEGTAINISNKTVLYAVWEAVSYIISFYYNGCAQTRTYFYDVKYQFVDAEEL